MTTAAQMTDLIWRLEHASEPTVELFNDCYEAAFGWPQGQRSRNNVARYTKFLSVGAWESAAIMLVPEGGPGFASG